MLPVLYKPGTVDYRGCLICNWLSHLGSLPNSSVTPPQRRSGDAGVLGDAQKLSSYLSSDVARSRAEG
jgi:hypothetical protein